MKRARMLSVPVTDDELRRLHALAEDADRSMASLVRTWLDDAWSERPRTKRPKS